MQLRRRRFLVPLVSGLLIGAVVGLRAKDAATDPDVFFFDLTWLFLLLIAVGIVGGVLAIPRRTRVAGVGILIGLLAWAAGFTGGHVLGPRHPPRLATMDVSFDGPFDLQLQGSATCIRHDGAVYMLTAPDDAGWRSGSSTLEIKMVSQGPDEPLKLFVGDTPTDAIIYATDWFDDLGFEHPAEGEAIVTAEGPLSGTAGRITFEHLPRAQMQPLPMEGLTIDGVLAPDEISGRIDWSCAS